ncbi:hypothetical protein EsHS_00004506 [Epichloe bromicola]
MSADISAGSAAPPNLNLGPEEKRVYGQLFRQADTEGVGVVTGDVAVKFFEKTKLDSRVLGEIWQIADNENRGFLTPAGFGIVLRLIGHAQAGREPTPEIALQQGPIPRFDGIWPPPPSLGSPTTGSPTPLSAQGTGGALRIPSLTPDKVAQYTGLFERQPLQANQLPGEQARNIFDKSGLPNETLGRIWALADTEQRGALALPEFVIAMHLLTSIKTGALRSLPAVLPAGLYEAAINRGAAPRQSPNNTGMAPIPRQLSGQAQMRTGSPLGRPLSQAGNDWAVSPADKAKFDQIYATMDKTNKGFITGEEAVPFFSQSNLSEDALAQIWDLADFNSQGQLNREGFAVAMYLIRQQRSGSGGPLPGTLPPNLLPPSVRNQRQPPPPFPPPATARPAPPPQQQQQQQQQQQSKSALDDLFGLEPTPNPPAPAPMQTTMSTGGSNANDPFAGGSAILSPSSPIRPTVTGGTFKPFVPSSSFGRGLTGPPGGNTPTFSEDLLEDNDPEASKKISGETTELANLSSQIGTLSKQMQDVQNKRTTTQAELNQTNSQKQNFEQRLAQLRALYEKEAEDARSLEEQLRKSRSETQKFQSECMTLEGTFRDVQTQHQQLTAALQADQQENAALRERIRVVNGEIAQIKPQIEKLRSDSRQQKGLVAINRKQLATTEGERDRLKKEAEELTRGGEDVSRQINSSSPASGAAQMASPALSTSSANNPFFKRTASTDIMGAFASPPARSYTDKSFDDVFGPSFAGSSTNINTNINTSSTPPPPPAFQQRQHTGASAASAGSFPNAGRASPNLSRLGTASTEPPAPPASRQISSSFLPFPDKPESLSSSRQVSPPASRADGPTAGGSRESNGEDDGRSETPGSTPLAGEAPAAVSVHDAVVKAKENEPSALSWGAKPDTFYGTDQAKAKADFDDAFATFSSGRSQPVAGDSSSIKDKTADGFSTEFPPISELERDDDSESESENGGFDDDFAPASPPSKDGKTQDTAAATDTKQPATASAVVGAAAPAVPAKQPVEEPSKSSEQPSSPATVTNNNSQSKTMTADDLFGAAEAPPSSSASASASASGAAKPTGKGLFDDLDDDFEGLEDAKEGSADDDFANISRDDFNPVFDSSPPASQAKTGSATQQKTADSHDWDAIFAGLDEPPSNVTPPGVVEGSGSTSHHGKNGPERPSAPGRALTEKGEHDDPILKSLTGMGYTRTDAVSALEKYDYNLEKAANHLASKS